LATDVVSKSLSVISAPQTRKAAGGARAAFP